MHRKGKCWNAGVFGLAAVVLMAVVVLCAKPLTSYATVSFNLSDSSGYAFDTAKVEFLNGQAQLKATTTPSWYNPSWKYRKKIALDHTKVSGDLAGFPVLISRTDPDWRNTANGGSVGKADGTDLVFTAADGVTPLSYEIENYASTTGGLVAWVKMPTLSSTTDTDVYAYYGNASAADQQNAGGVWDSNYQAVLHMDKPSTSSSPQIIDSTGDLQGAAPRNFNGTASSTTGGVGKIDGATQFDGIDDYLVTGTIPVSEVGTDQEGVATDGTYVYISEASYDKLYKYTLSGILVASSTAAGGHLGGMTYVNGYIYVAESACPSSGTSADQHIYRYDATTLQKVAEYNISSDFSICAGAIAYNNEHFYVAESYWDATHNDKIVEYDTSFNKITSYSLNHQCYYGIQGIEYFPPVDKFRLTCHDMNYLDVDSSFSNASIATSSIASGGNYMATGLQDLAYLSGSTVLYNDRNSQVIRIINDPTFAFRNFSDPIYTAQAWFRIDGGAGTRRAIFESTPSYWSISAEVNASNLLAYSIQTSGTTVTKATNIIPATGVWHSIAVVYKNNTYSKIYYDGSELTSYRGAPTGSLYSFDALNIGTYRSADGRFFNGGIDEVRVSNTERSAAWLSTEFTNENAPSSFYSSIGSQSVPYGTDNPTVQPTSATPFTSLSGFSETATKNGGEIQYQLSNDGGTTWYWYNSGWVTTTSGYAESNTAAQINANIATFPLGSGQFVWRAYLHSDGTQLVQLSNITLAYLNDTTAPVITLNGASTMTLPVGQTFSDPGASATDETDGSVSVIVGGDSVNTATPGTYRITYDAVDSAGNHANQVTRTIIVTVAQINDTTAPVNTSSGLGGGGMAVDSGPLAPSSAGLPGYTKPRPQIDYPDGTIVYLDAAVSTASSTTTSQPTPPASFNFTHNYQLRDVGEDIKLLQRYLNIHGFDLAPTGLGSPGNETTTFGMLTYKALVKFQLAHNVPGTGFLGPLTRGALNTTTALY